MTKIKICSTIKYYTQSLIDLLLYFNFWRFPAIIFTKYSPKIKVGKFKFYVENFMDVWAIKEVIVNNQYQFPKNKEQNRVIDIGGGVGDFSIMLSSKTKKVYVYEQNLVKRNLIKKNLKINNIKNVEVYKTATSLNNILKNIQVCDFLKIDCEGCEYNLLLNATKKTFKKINFIAMEAHRFNPKMKKQYLKLVQKLKKNKFKVIEKPNAVHRNINFIYAKKI